MTRTGKPVGETVEDVANDRAGRRRHDADDLWQKRRLALPRGVEQPLLGEFPAPRLEQRHQRPDAGQLQRLDHDLVGRFARESSQSPSRDDLEPVFGLEPHPLEGGAPDDGVEAGVGVLEARNRRGRRNGVHDSRKSRPARGRSRTVFDRALERARQFADGDLGRICSRARPARPSPDYARSRPDEAISGAALGCGAARRNHV